jgi:2,4-dienoyl-CoA reductase-like NADH-dependent reductase (Old Yellow Enzyme family)
MATLFEKTIIKSMTLANRSVRSATWEGLANEDGTTNSRLNNLMVELARGGVGLIITGLAYVHKNGQSDPWQLGIDRDECISGLHKLTGAVHEAGGKIAVQISHAGIESDPSLSGSLPQGPTAMKNSRGEMAREMTGDMIHDTCEHFKKAAARAREAGFDALQLHGAHGWLQGQFLSSYYNRRKDEYGGSLENKARFTMELLKSARSAVGDDFPILMKLNSCDYLENGFSIDEMLELSVALERAGIDAIELSGGTKYSGKYNLVREGRLATEKEEVYYREAAGRYKQKVNVPLILVGGIRSYTVVEKLLDDGLVDYVSFCRPFIREPGLINRWKSGDTSRATCLSDNLCTIPARSGRGLWCVVEEGLQSKRIK